MKRFFFFIFGPVGYFFVCYKVIVSLKLISDITNNFFGRVAEETHLLYWGIWLFLVIISGMGLLSASFRMKSEDLPNPLLILVEITLLYYVTRWTYYLGFYKGDTGLEILAGLWTLIIGPIQLLLPILPIITIEDRNSSGDSQSSDDEYKSIIKSRVSTYTNVRGKTIKRTTTYFGKGRKDITDERLN